MNDLRLFDKKMQPDFVHLIIGTQLGHEIMSHVGSIGEGAIFQTTESSRRPRTSMLRNDRQHYCGGSSVNRRRVGCLLTTLLMSVSAAAQQPTNAGAKFGLAPGPHAVGFRLLVERDRSRYVSASDGSIGTYARPIRVYVWYPTKAASNPMRFGRYAALADDDVWPAEISGRARLAEVLAWGARVFTGPGSARSAA